ncbi:hypothetical protein HDK64DRAFT_74361 [Phyllosticta capitalensis]
MTALTQLFLSSFCFLPFAVLAALLTYLLTYSSRASLPTLPTYRPYLLHFYSIQSNFPPILENRVCKRAIKRKEKHKSEANPPMQSSCCFHTRRIIQN